MYRFEMASSVMSVITNFVKTHQVALELKQTGLTSKRTNLIYVACSIKIHARYENLLKVKSKANPVTGLGGL
jgi:hypothetical protein